MSAGNLTDKFRQRVEELHASLSIPADYIDSCPMPLQVEEIDLCSSGCDIFGREQRMTPRTFRCWEAMQSAALDHGIELLLVSAFRSLDYQCELFRKKLSKGQPLEEILKVNAAPGFSEHHTGCALDLTTGKVEPLTEDFENTPAFCWLQDHASVYNFYLSFPRENSFGIIYEPWHWACRN
jgi:D-alanyl-D-alanine carboxypeptidase